MNFSELLKASKGLPVDDTIAALWGKKIYDANEWQITTLTGSLPLSFLSKSEALTDYLLHGTSEGAGVETSGTEPAGYKIPLMVTSGVTENLWDDETIEFSSITRKGIYVDFFETYTIYNPTEYNILVGYGESEYNLYDRSVVCPAGSIVQYTTTKSSSAYNAVAFFVDTAAPDNTIMIVKGSTAPSSYIPHRYTADYPLYIGSTKLGAEEFIDYASQKIYSLKEVHTDTVTINGIEWDILGYDHDTVYKADGTRAQHTVTIQTRNAQPNMQFDAPEAWYYAENALAAGAYYFTIDPTYDATFNTYKDSGYQFTLTQDIPAGGVLTLSWGVNAQASGMTLSSYATAGATTAIESNITVSEGTTGTNLGELTSAGDPTNNRNSIAKARFGSNNYKESAIRQYLNSDKAAGSVWTPQTKFDRPPSWVASTNGFLYGVDSDFLSVLGNAQKVTSKNTVTDGGGTEATSEKVFLLSTTEAYGGGSEGAAYDYYKNYSDLSGAGTGADANRIKYRNNTAQIWWIRSPDQSSATVPRVIASTGMVYNNYANSRNSYGVVPACCIVLDDLSTNSYLQTIFAKSITDPPAPLPAITAYAGENTISSTETVGEAEITGRIKSII